MPVPILLSIHVEPTHRLVRGGRQDWTGVAELFDLLTDRRARLEDASGRAVRFNWSLRADPQIEIAYGRPDWVFDRHGDRIARLQEAGDVVGLHVHTWRPVRRFFRDSWIAEFEDAKWICHCLAVGLEAFQDRMGAAPAAFSFGDNFMHARALPILQEAGVRIDYSMDPGLNISRPMGRGERCTGRIPDYSATPRVPFRPSVEDFRVPGPQTHALWELPVSSGLVGSNRDGSPRRSKLLLGSNPDWVGAICAQALNQPMPYILAESRTDVLTRPKTRARYLEALDYLEALARDEALEFAGFDTVGDRLDSGQWVAAA
ncbi:hypothetical protein HKCCSP123_12525 [Rhodobacterales bacterium HKCCSP123]|nr:hypothetical protein [Rhodobacterales bacterium HKCCSP123]